MVRSCPNPWGGNIWRYGENGDQIIASRNSRYEGVQKGYRTAYGFKAILTNA